MIEFRFKFRFEDRPSDHRTFRPSDKALSISDSLRRRLKTAQQTDIAAYRPAIATKGKDAHKCKKDFSGWTSIAIVVVIVVTWIL